VKILRSLALTLGFVCLVIGVAAVLSGGTVEHVVRLGESLIIGGAIIITGAIISAAIISRNND